MYPRATKSLLMYILGPLSPDSDGVDQGHHGWRELVVEPMPSALPVHSDLDVALPVEPVWAADDHAPPRAEAEAELEQGDGRHGAGLEVEEDDVRSLDPREFPLDLRLELRVLRALVPGRVPVLPPRVVDRHVELGLFKGFDHGAVPFRGLALLDRAG